MPSLGLVGVSCTRSDGATITVTFNCDPDTLDLTSGRMVSTAPSAVDMIALLGKEHRERRIPVAPGTRNFTANQLAQLGMTTAADFANFTVVCV